MKKILLLSTLALFLNSCSDSRSEGCTDSYAVNYESFADYDDGSCDYIADVVFFYDAITANELNAAEFDRLDSYIEFSPGTYTFIGSEDPTFIAAGIPQCYESTYVTTDITWSGSYNANINYMVYGIHDIGILGELETEVDLYSFNLGANECAAVPIRFITKKKK